MRCIKCGKENFILDSTIVVNEVYAICKNGRVQGHPFKTNVVNEDMSDNENLVRCTNCNTGYVIKGAGRVDLLRKVDFSKISLKDDAIATRY